MLKFCKRVKGEGSNHDFEEEKIGEEEACTRCRYLSQKVKIEYLTALFITLYPTEAQILYSHQEKKTEGIAGSVISRVKEQYIKKQELEQPFFVLKVEKLKDELTVPIQITVDPTTGKAEGGGDTVKVSHFEAAAY